MVSHVRSYIVFFLLVVMLVGLGVLLVIRSRPDHQMPVALVTPPESSDSDAGNPSADGAVGSKTSSGGTKTKGNTSSAGGGKAAKGSSKNGTKAKVQGSKSGGDAGPTKAGATPEKLLDRPLRVIGHGWEVIAPGLVANRGTTPGENSLYTKNGLELHLNLVDEDRRPRTSPRSRRS